MPQNRTDHRFPLLVSEAAGDVLVALLIVGGDWTVTELVAYTGRPRATVDRAVDQIAKSGAVRVTNRYGTTRLLAADDTSPVTAPLRSLLEVTHGPAELLAQPLSAVAGIEEAFVFGSWAARSSGVAGECPGDIDVLVVGTASVTDVALACVSAEQRLRRDVNPLVTIRENWSNPDHFLTGVRNGPLIKISLPTSPHTSTAPVDGAETESMTDVDHRPLPSSRSARPRRRQHADHPQPSSVGAGATREEVELSAYFLDQLGNP